MCAARANTVPFLFSKVFALCRSEETLVGCALRKGYIEQALELSTGCF